MGAAGQERISVVRNNELVPLLPGHRIAREAQPWHGVLLEQHAVQASEIPEHEHRDFCLHLQLSGSSDFEWWSEGKNKTEATRPGGMILLGPGTRDRLHWQGPSDRLIVSLKPEVLSRVAELADHSPSLELQNRWSLYDPALENLLHEMGREAAAGWPFGALYSGMLEEQLAQQLLQRHVSHPISFPQVSGRIPMPLLKRVFEYVHAHLHRDLNLQELASQAGHSPFHFAREFRNTTGQTPHQYVLDQRIARSKELLKQKGIEVQSIALEVGFHSSVNFVRAFRGRVGIAPGAWRATLA